MLREPSLERLSELKRALQRAYNGSMHRIFILLLLLPALQALAEPLPSPKIAAISLGELAAKADLVVLAQVRDTDYLTRREIPVSGSAYLQVLIPYKTGGKEEIIEVYEKGLHEHECYFPNPGVLEEGRRYLLFLQKDPEDEKRFRGLPEGCALDVLVASDNGYVLRYPVTGIALSDPLGNFARDTAFSDGYAVVDDEDLLPEQRDAMLDAGLIRPYREGRWIYTRGISLATARELMGLDALEP
jgi:hypothetical protein